MNLYFFILDSFWDSINSFNEFDKPYGLSNSLNFIWNKSYCYRGTGTFSGTLQKLRMVFSVFFLHLFKLHPSIE